MYPNTNLQPGMSGPEVKKLQDFLVSKGLLSPTDMATGPGIYGPRTTAAVKKFQEQSGVNNSSGPGYWGPLTIKAASGAGASVGAGNASSQPYTDDEYNKALSEHPIIQTYTSKGNTVESLANAAETGDFSGLVNQFGQPFSLEDQQAALKQAEEDTKLYYDALKQKETADTEAALAQKKADYQDYLLKSGQQFQTDKTSADQEAADKGVLFSGSRVQREQNLQKAYQQDQATKQRNLTADVGETARDYQYKYGNASAGGLSNMYSGIGSNTYNPNVATGGVSSGGLSTVYNPNQYNFQGTQNVAQKAATNQRAAGLLWNKGNKLVATGNQNKY